MGFSASETRTLELREEISRLQQEKDTVSLTLTGLQQRLGSPEIHAFQDAAATPEIRAVETPPAFLATGTYTVQLPLAEQIFLLNIRSQLASRDGLGAALTALDTLLTSVRNIASNEKTPENLARASFLVDAIPHVKGIVPIIGEYLQSNLAKITAIDNAIKASGWWGKASALQDLQLQELRARENLAYATFDALFGAMTKPSSVPSYVAFSTDPKPANILASIVYTMHRNLPATVVSQKVTIKSDGTIASFNDAAFATGIDMFSDYMVSVRTATTDFTKKMLGAKELIKATFASAALTELTELPSAASVLTEDDDIGEEGGERKSQHDGDTTTIVKTSNGGTDHQRLEEEA